MVRLPSIAAASLVLLGCDGDPPTTPALAAAPAPGDALPGTYRLTRSGAARIDRWAKTLGKPEGVAKRIELLEVARAADGEALVVSVGNRGPYTLRPAGRDTWTYPIDKRWKVTVRYRDHRHGFRVRVGPLAVTYGPR